MNDVVVNDASSWPFHSFRFPDFEASWAGPNPFVPGFCFGSERGQVEFTDEQFLPNHDGLGKVSVHDEAVNGIAHIQGWLAVTTRKDINLINLGQIVRSSPQGSTIPGGAFGVEAAPSGHFVFPMGPQGLMFVRAGAEPETPVMISSANNETLNLQRVLALPDGNGSDLIICAGRRGGVGVMRFREECDKHPMTTIRFKDLDIVDVCQLQRGGSGLAVAAAARDGTVILIRDILNDRMPKTIKFHNVTGAVYRILTARGDIFLLTSKGLFVLTKLAERFVKGVALGTFVTDVLGVPVAAADANLVGDRWMVAVGADVVMKFDLDQMPKPPLNLDASSDRRSLSEVTATPRWEEEIVDQEATRVPVTA
jgi:hypothetical protein